MVAETILLAINLALVNASTGVSYMYMSESFLIAKAVQMGCLFHVMSSVCCYYLEGI